jgi:hypothetical protein
MNMRQLLSLLLSVFMIVGVMPAQNAKVKTVDHINAAVGRSIPSLDSTVHMTNMVEQVARHCGAYLNADGSVNAEACAADPTTVFYTHKSHNLLTNAGKDKIANQLSAAGAAASATAVCQWIALANDTSNTNVGTVNNTDTTIATSGTGSTELTTNGMARVAVTTQSHTNGTSTYILSKVFTDTTAASTMNKAGVFDAASTGNMCFENLFTQVTLQINDTLTVTWTITLS